MLKKLLSLALCLLLAAALPVPALADVIWEPEDDFYWAHYDECVRSGDAFLAPTDTVVWKSPADRTAVGSLPAGESVGTPYLWADPGGDRWGYVDFPQDDGWVSGWINLSDPGAAPASSVPVLLIVLVAAVVLVTAGALALLLRKTR